MPAYLITELLFSLVFSVVFTLLAFLFEKNRSALDFVAYFIVLFLLIWAGGVWIRPFGPELWGVAFIRFFIVGLIATLFTLALAPNRKGWFFPRRIRGEMIANPSAGVRTPGARIILLTGIMIAVLVAIIVFGYVVPRE
jgi:hypothetical protein